LAVRRLRLTEIVSFDADFDRVDGIRRIDPGRCPAPNAS
jgi:predicted nucleic acid-binding protein